MSLKQFLNHIMPVSKHRLDGYFEELKKENKELKDLIKKLEEEIKGNRRELHDTHLDTGKIRNEVHTVRTEIQILSEITQGNRGEIHDVHLDTGKVRNEIHDVHLDTGKIRKEVHEAYQKINQLTEGVYHINGAVGNIDKKILNTKKMLEYKLYKYMAKDKIPEALTDWYYEKTGKDIDLSHPETYNEIIQWTKLYDFDDEKCKLADKYLVRDWVKQKIGEKYLIPLLGVWEHADEIDFDQLPSSFVLKCNHGCGYNIIVKNKEKEDVHKIKKQLNDWIHEQFAYKFGFEMQYVRIHPLIIAEEYIENDNEDLYDYKVFCFNGKAKYIMFLSDRKTGLKGQIYDLEWKLQPFVHNFEKSNELIQKPDNLDELIECAEKLAKDFIQVRVDFYRLNDGSWKFGEMTFTTASGMGKWTPEEYDKILGDMIQLPDSRN